MIRNDTHDVTTGTVTSEVIDLDAGTVTVEVDGKVVESRRLTADEIALLVPPPSEVDRLAALEAQNAALLESLAKVTSLAQVRAAALAAAAD